MLLVDQGLEDSEKEICGKKLGGSWKKKSEQGMDIAEAIMQVMAITMGVEGLPLLIQMVLRLKRG